MRQKRVKTYRKVMQLYCSSFGFREPYQLLVDADFCKAVVHQNMEFQARVEDVLQGVVKPMITQCSMQVLYDTEGPEGQRAVDMAKGFERRLCGHLKARPEEECLISMGGTDNKNRYVIATQSLALRKILRGVAGLPIVYIARSVVLLEAPSDKTLAKKKEMENQKLHVPASELALLKRSNPTMSNSTPLIDSLHSTNPTASTSSPLPPSTTPVAPPKKRKIKGPSGPNPLSMAKKKKPTKKEIAITAAGGAEKVLERKRPRIEEEGGRVGTVARGEVLREGAGEGKRKRRRKAGKGEAEMKVGKEGKSEARKDGATAVVGTQPGSEAVVA